MELLRQWVGRQVGSQVVRQVDKQVCRQICTQVGGQVGRQICRWVRRRAGRQAGGWIDRQTDWQMGRRIGRQVGTSVDRQYTFSMQQIHVKAYLCPTNCTSVHQRYVPASNALCVSILRKDCYHQPEHVKEAIFIHVKDQMCSYVDTETLDKVCCKTFRFLFNLATELHTITN